MTAPATGSPAVEQAENAAGEGFRHLGETQVHQGHVWYVAVADYESPDGDRFRRDIVRSPGAVGVVAILPPDEAAPQPSGVTAAENAPTNSPANAVEPHVVLVAQYRPPYGRALIEIPAGLRDIDDEPPTETARRELIEEAGLEAATIEHLTDVYPSPGMTDSITIIMLATDCRRVPQELQGPEEQRMQLVELPLSEAVAMVERGEIGDAKTVAGLLLAQRRLGGGGAAG